MIISSYKIYQSFASPNLVYTQSNQIKRLHLFETTLFLRFHRGAHLVKFFNAIYDVPLRENKRFMVSAAHFKQYSPIINKKGTGNQTKPPMELLLTGVKLLHEMHIAFFPK